MHAIILDSLKFISLQEINRGFYEKKSASWNKISAFRTVYISPDRSEEE